MTTDANHDELREQVALYVIGALAGTERAAVDAHLPQCAECAAELAAFVPVGSALAQIVPQHDPPAALRAKVLAAAAPPSSTQAAFGAFAVAPWLAAAAMLVLAVGLGVYAGEL